MRSLSILLLMILAMFVGEPAAAQQRIEVDNLAVQSDGSIVVEQNGQRYVIAAPNQRPNDRRPADFRLQSGNDGVQYIPPYHGYSQMVRPRYRSGDGVQYVGRPHPNSQLVRRRRVGDGVQYIAPAHPGSQLVNPPRTPVQQGLDDVTYDNQPGTVKPDGDGRPEGLTRDQVDYDQPRQRRQQVTQGERTVYDRCPYLEGTALARNDPRC